MANEHDTAYDHSRETRHLLANHIQLTDVHLSNLRKLIEGVNESANERSVKQEKGFEEVKSILKWAGGLIISLILTVLGWALVQQVNANDAQRSDMKQQLELIREREVLRLENIQLQSTASDEAKAALRPSR